MTTAYSNATPLLAQIHSIENQISKGKLQEAVQALNALAAIAPNDPRLFILGAKVAEASHNPAAALEAARHAHALAPHWPAGSLLVAQLLATKGDTEQAMDMARRSLRDAAAQQSVSVDHLKQCASLARSLNQFQAAHEWLLAAHALAPTSVSIQYQLALLEISLGGFASAVDRLTLCLKQVPDDVSLLIARMQAHLFQKQNALALQDGERVVALGGAGDNAEFAFYLGLARGEAPAAMPPSLVAQTFAELAGEFDQKLQGNLGYKLPKEMAARILQWYPERNCDILDLGCGTGLLGANLGPMKGVIVGVDLSQEMVNQALHLGVYDKFHVVNIEDALKATPAAQYDIIAALDVLIYLGALDQAFTNVLRILTPGGRFVFSCETAPASVAEFTLTDAHRFAHQRSYVERLLHSAGFTHITVEDTTLRLEAGQPVQGFVVQAAKESKNAK
jgi:predicted TPR repeat methyltransferase